MTRRAAVSALASLGLAATGLAPSPLRSPQPHASAPRHGLRTPPAISLYAPPELEAYAEGGRVYPALGHPGGRAGRPTCRCGPHRTATTSRSRPRSGPRPVRRALPAGSLKDFSGDRRLHRHRRASGGHARRRWCTGRSTRCLSSTGERVRPEAAATSPYPRYCPYNPYTLGSVMGVQKGWASNIFESTGLRPLPLRPGALRRREQDRPQVLARLRPHGGDGERHHPDEGRRRLSRLLAARATTPTPPRTATPTAAPPGARPTAASSGRVAGPGPRPAVPARLRHRAQRQAHDPALLRDRVERRQQPLW